MAGRYVPPALRRKQEASSADSPTQSFAYTPPSQRRKFSEYSPPVAVADEQDLYSSREIEAYFWKGATKEVETKSGTTLHPSAESPDALAFVILYQGANPKWTTDRTIFVKSNLDLLPTRKTTSEPLESSQEPDPASTAEETPPTSQDDTPAPHAPFAVFEQKAKGYGYHQRFYKFVGWYCVWRLEVLQPRSEALIRMLEKKWAVTDAQGNVKMDRFGNARQRVRDTNAWEQSLGYKWAVVKMEEVKDGNEEPKIERLKDEEEEPSRSKEKKSVNELLQELRLDRQTVKAEESEETAKDALETSNPGKD